MSRLQTDNLETFSERLFRALDRLGGNLLPFSLSGRPSAFEKYPRMLVALIQRHGVEAGFQEWSTKVLRDANDYRKAEAYPELESLRDWLLEHRAMFEEDKTHLAHLKRSLYGRAYAYLYPRRLLTTAYAEAHRGNEKALDEEVIRARFRQTVNSRIEQLRDIYGEGEKLERIVVEAEDFLVANRRRYTWKERSQITDHTNP